MLNRADFLRDDHGRQDGISRSDVQTRKDLHGDSDSIGGLVAESRDSRTPGEDESFLDEV